MGKYVPLDLPPEMVAAIDRLARAEERSRSGMIRILIRRALPLYEAELARFWEAPHPPAVSALVCEEEDS